jgi:hypothetical protein
MSELSYQVGVGGFLTFAMALSALVVACLSYVQVQKNTLTLSSQSKVLGETPSGLHGAWQVCGQVDAISK